MSQRRCGMKILGKIVTIKVEEAATKNGKKAKKKAKQIFSSRNR